MKKLIIVHRWSIIAAQLPGRTDNDIKNYWNTKLKKKLMAMIPPLCQQRFRPQYPSSISSLLQTSSSSSSPSSSPSESYRGSNNSTHCRSAFQGIPFSPTLMTTSCSSTSDLQINPQEGLITTQILQHYQVKDQHYQASCSSSDGSCSNNEYGTNRDAVLQQMCHLQQPSNSNSNSNNNNYYYLCNGVEENQKMIQISQGDCIINNTTSQKQSGNINIINGVWGGGGGDDQTTTALEYGLEEIKQLISTSSCSNFLFDENKTDQERVVMYY